LAKEPYIELREEYIDGLAEAILLHKDSYLASSTEKFFRKKKAQQIRALKKKIVYKANLQKNWPHINRQ
jgi:hypothetical protein